MDPVTLTRLHAWAVQEQGKELVRRVVRALGTEVRVMPLKGMLLGALGIVHPAERPMRDVDLLVDRLSEGELVRRLVRAGFQVTEVPLAPGYVSLAHPEHGKLWLDLHTRTAPIGLGRLPRSYLFTDARPDERAFGVRVFIPKRERLVIQLVANMLKDHVIHARPHAADDLAAVLAPCSSAELDAIARELARVSLLRAGTRALIWAQRRTSSPALTNLLAKLPHGPNRFDRLAVQLEAQQRTDTGGVLARVRARAQADDIVLRALAVLAAGSSLVVRPLRRSWLASARVTWLLPWDRKAPSRPTS